MADHAFSKHFAEAYYQKGWSDAQSGKEFDPPMYNKKDREYYRLGFDEERATRNGSEALQ